MTICFLSPKTNMAIMISLRNHNTFCLYTFYVIKYGMCKSVVHGLRRIYVGIYCITEITPNLFPLQKRLIVFYLKSWAKSLLLISKTKLVTKFRMIWHIFQGKLDFMELNQTHQKYILNYQLLTTRALSNSILIPTWRLIRSNV